MRKMALIIGLAALASAGCQTIPNPFVAKVQIPYFEPLTTRQLCGKSRGYCQPTSSRTYEAIRDPLDYNGRPETLLGRSYLSIYENEPCTIVPSFEGRASADDDVEYFGQSGINGKLTSDTRAAFNAGVNGDIDKFVQTTFPNFPEPFKAEAKAKLESKFQSALTQSASITYHRMDLTQPFRDLNLDACLNQLPSNERVITGVSLITVSGDWSQEIVQETLAELEASGEYRSLSADLKATFAQRRNLALRGNFEPQSLVFAVAFRSGRSSPSA